MSKKTKSTVEELVRRLKEVIDDEDPEDQAEELLAQLSETKDPAAVRLLLTMRASDDEWNYGQMQEMLSTVTNLPPKIFIPEVAKLAGSLCRNLPLLFGDLLSIIIGRHLDQFIADLPELAPDDQECLLRHVEKAWEERGSPAKKEKFDKLFTRLRKASS